MEHSNFSSVPYKVNSNVGSEFNIGDDILLQYQNVLSRSDKILHAQDGGKFPACYHGNVVSFYARHQIPMAWPMLAPAANDCWDV